MTARARRRADEIGATERVVIYLVMLLASLAYNYSFILIDYIRPYLVRDAGMTLAETTLLYSVQAGGVIAGSFAIPPLVARLGSKTVLVLCSLMIAACTLATLALTGFWAWATMRLLVGIALPGCYIASISFLANVFPPRLRGRLLSVNMAMFSVSLISFGLLGSQLGDGGWLTLVRISAGLPLAVAIIAALLLPDDRKLDVYANDDASDADNRQAGSWREMFASRRLRLTLMCILIAGLNFSAYQFYSGFITTYLMTVRNFSSDLIGLFVAVDGIGTLAGTVLWGIVADRYGRRANLLGFLLAAVCVGAFLVAPTIVWLLVVIELLYAIGLSCTNCWAAYFAELFPVRLRPMGTSLFHGGHIISLFAPLIVAMVSQHAPLGVGMALAPASFVLAALIWSRLPETLRTSRSYRGFDPETA